MTKKILVIDDDAMNREVMEAFLEGEGYQVALANNGRVGLQSAERFSPDLVILDVRLPDMLGYDVCRQIKAVYTQLPVMIVTGYDAADELENGLAAGADDFLPRPFSGDILINRVTALLYPA